MISFIQGIIQEKQPPQLVVNVNGIGYEMFVPMTTFYELPEEGQHVTLYTHLIIREDAHTLYGFVDKLSRHVFQTLIKVNGIGPKAANGILSGMDATTFMMCINEQNAAPLICIPGIGKKTAERILLDLKDKFTSYQLMGEHFSINATSHTKEAIAALEALGYKPQEAAKAVHSFKDQDLNSQDLIRKALQTMVN